MLAGSGGAWGGQGPQGQEQLHQGDGCGHCGNHVQPLTGWELAVELAWVLLLHALTGWIQYVQTGQKQHTPSSSRTPPSAEWQTVCRQRAWGGGELLRLEGRGVVNAPKVSEGFCLTSAFKCSGSRPVQKHPG